MPGLTGLQFIKSTAENPMFILVTAYEKYALEGYNLDVVDYLVKPVELDRFIKACNKAKDLYNLKHKAQVNKEIVQDYIFINVDYSLVKVLFSDIVYVEALKDYVKFHLKSTDKFLVTRMSMKNVEDELPPSQFLRIHKSYIVSKAFITAIRKSSVFINNLELPVGDLYKQGVDEYTRR